MKICTIDPGFKKCGIIVMNTDFVVEHAENVDFIAEHKKGSQADYTVLLWKSITKTIQHINDKYKPDKYIIESQIGKFACV